MSLFTFIKGPAHPLCHAEIRVSSDCNCSSTVSNYMISLTEGKVKSELKLRMYLNGFQNTGKKKKKKKIVSIAFQSDQYTCSVLSKAFLIVTIHWIHISL